MKRPSSPRLLALVLAAGLVAPGCTEATVYRHCLPRVNGVILSSDEESLRVAVGGVEQRVDGAPIEEIRHPGTTTMIVGASILAWAGGAYAWYLGSDGTSSDAMIQVMSAAPVGVTVGLVGVVSWLLSTGRAEPFESARERNGVPILPFDCPADSSP